MVHPRELLRTDSNDRGSQFSAPLGNYSSNQVDCGLTYFPFLNRWFNLEKFAKTSVLLSFIILIGVIQGTLFSYFQGTSNIWKQQYKLSDSLLECLLKSNEVLTGFVALLVSYWGNRIHRASWIGGLTIFQSIVGLLLIIPEIFHPFSGKAFPQEEAHNLCSVYTNISQNNATAESLNEVAIGVILLYQLFSGFGSVALYSLALSYLDDSVEIKNSAIFIATVLLSKELGKQFGMNLSWIIVSNESSRVFLSPVFLVLSILLFLVGVFVAMFPKHLPSVLLKKAVASILDIANGIEPKPEKNTVDGLFESLWRILKNTILIVNILICSFIFSAMINYESMKPIFYQSFFYFPAKVFDPSGYNDPWLGQVTTNLIKQPFIALSMLMTGFFISKVKPRARALVSWNIKAISVAIITYGTLAFYNCDKSLQSELNDRITTPYCSSSCSCSESILFSPVCMEVSQTTYFSACHAGCSVLEEVNDIKIFENCTCGSNIYEKINTRGTLGSCNKNCQVFWGASQANVIVAAGFLASTVVISFFITLRCVQTTDKSIALGLQLTFVGIMPHIPFRIIYLVVADLFCQYRTSEGYCRLHTQTFGIFLTVATIILLLIAVLLTVLLIILVKELELYKEPKLKNGDDKTNDEELQELEQRRDNNSRDNLFRTSSPSNGNLDNRLKDFSPQSGVIPEEVLDENYSKNNRENGRLLSREPEQLDFTLSQSSPTLSKNEAEIDVHANPQDSDDDSFKTIQDNNKPDHILESNL